MSKIFNSPSKYIQGPDELAKLGGYVDPLGTKALVINTPSGVKRVGAKVEAGFAEAKATPVYEDFNGECSENEVNRLVEVAKANGCDVIVGIGGGTLSVPFLLWNNLDMRKAIGTSAAIGFPIALAGCFGYIVNGWNAANLPPYSFGYIYLPGLFCIVIVSMFTAPLGARLAQTLPVPKLKKCFALLLIVVGIRMLLKAL